MPAPSYRLPLPAFLPRRLIPLLIGLALIAGPTPPPAVAGRPEAPPVVAARAPVPQPVSSDLLATPRNVDLVTARKFAVALYRARAEYGFGTVEFAVLTRDGLTWSGFDGPRPETPFVIGSVTKTFVAATVLQLAEEGRIGLDDAVSQHLDRFAPGVTIRQLLNHTSGIADLYNPTIRRVLDRWPNGELSPQRILRNAGSRRFTAGDGYSYSNTNYLLLAMLVERVTGQTLEAEVQARFLDPLAMTDTTMLRGSVQSPRLSAGWASAFWGSGAMTSTARDLVNWGQGLYGTRMHSVQSVRQMLRFGDRGYGLGAQRLWIGGRDYPGHSGLLGRDTTLLVWVPEKQVAVAVIVNRPSSKVDDLLVYRHGDNPSLLRLAMNLAG